MADHPDEIRRRRLEEIEIKKKRVEEMRRAREKMTAKTVATPPPEFANRNLPTPGGTLNDNGSPIAERRLPELPPATGTSRLDADALISSLLGSPSKSIGSPGSMSSSSPIRSTLGVGGVTSARERAKLFGRVRCSTAILIPPRERVVYDKSCQTDTDDVQFSTHDDDFSEIGTSEFSSPALRSRRSVREGVSKIQFAPSVVTINNSVGMGIASGGLPGSLYSDDKGEKSETKTFTEEQLENIYNDPAFLQFFSSTSIRIERALEFNDRVDILSDLTSGQDYSSQSKQSAIETQGIFEDETLRGRPIMDLKFSPLKKDVFLTALGDRPQLLRYSSGETESPGILCVWTNDLHRRPEAKLHTSSPVTSAIFDNRQDGHVVGGCYNGQLFIWDYKTRKVLKRSQLTGKGHKHPIYCMGFTGIGIVNELVTISIDGLMCHWDTTLPSLEPIAVVYLAMPVSPRSLDISHDFSFIQASISRGVGPLDICCMALIHGPGVDAPQTSGILVGSGAGQILRCSLPHKPNADPDQKLVQAHMGLITSIHPHPQQNHSLYRSLVLTASLDWTIKLWHLGALDEPLCTLSPCCEYVCDVQWSPTHPGVFASITSTGKLSLWNLAHNEREPINTVDLFSNNNDPSSTSNITSTALNASTTMAKSASLDGVSYSNRPALNKIEWNIDGKNILVGDSVGIIHHVKVSTSLTSISAADEARLESLIHKEQRAVFDTAIGTAPVPTLTLPEHLE